MTYTTRQACALAGVSYRQAHFWASKGILGDHLLGKGSGHYLHWLSADVLALSAIAAFVRFMHGLSDHPKGSQNGVTELGPSIASAIRQIPDAAWLVVDPDRAVTAHRTLPDAVRVITLRGGLLIDLAAHVPVEAAA